MGRFREIGYYITIVFQTHSKYLIYEWTKNEQIQSLKKYQ